MAVKIGIMSFAHMHAWGYTSYVNEIPEALLVGIADDNSDRGREMADRFETNYFASYDALLEQDIDAVIIAAENARHKELTLMAAAAGKHVLCEKPIATTVEDARETIEACRRQDVKLMTSFPCRYSPAVLRVKELVGGGSIGKIQAIKGTNRGRMPGGWFIELDKSGGGAVIDHTVHVTDLMRWLMASEPVEVYAEISNLMHHGNYDDVGMLTITFDNGVFSTLDTSWSCLESFPIWGDVTMTIMGTEGVILMDMLAQRFTLYADNATRANWVYYGDNVDLVMVRDFAVCIAEDRPVSITGEDGLKALEVALAAYKSADTGMPVRLPL